MKCLRRRSKDLRLDDRGGNDRYALLKKRCENKAFEKGKLPVFVSKLCTRRKRNSRLHCCKRLSLKWYQRESNQRHKDFQSFALPTELWHHRFGRCRSLLQTLRAIAMLCLTRCECKGKQKISTSKRFGLFLHFIFIVVLDRLMLNLYDYARMCLLCRCLCEMYELGGASRRGGFRL